MPKVSGPRERLYYDDSDDDDRWVEEILPRRNYNVAKDAVKRADEAIARADERAKRVMERVDRRREEIDRLRAALLAGRQLPERQPPEPPVIEISMPWREPHARFERAAAMRKAFYSGVDFGSWSDPLGTPLAAFRVSPLARARLDIGRLKRRLRRAWERWSEPKRLPPPSQGPYR